MGPDGKRVVVLCGACALSVFGPAAIGQVSLFPNARLATGRPASAVAVADLDHDSDVDAIATNTQTSDLTVLQNDGAGGFAVSAYIPCGNLPLGTILEDFDSDGNVDILVLLGGSALLEWGRGDGLGGFAPPTIVATPQPFDLFGTGDVDGDGDVDVVLTASGQGSGNLVSMLSDGAGGFGAVISPIVKAIQSLSVVDATGDGVLDVLGVEMDTSNLVTTYRGHGGGQFQAIAALDFGFVITTGITSGDFDEDGDVDTATLFQSLPSTVTWFAITDNDGAGHFTLSSNQQAELIYADEATARDLDGDGALDLIGFNPSKGGVWLPGTGHGTFGSGKWLPTSGSGVVADVDGDGLVEVLSVNLDPESSFGVTATGAFGEYEGDRQDPFSTYSETGDFDSDGDPELIGFRSPSTYEIGGNDGLGHFALATSGSIPGSIMSDQRGPRIADFDSDGRLDILIWGADFSPAYVGLGDGAGDIANWKTTPLPTDTLIQANHGEVGDFDLDGILDFAVGMNHGGILGLVGVDIRRGVGDGTFGAIMASPTFGPMEFGYYVRPLEAIDFDLDGRLDLVAADKSDQSSSSTLRISVSRGIGPFAFGPVVSTPIGSGGALQLEPGDFDGDGKLDLAVLGSSSPSSVLAVRGNGLGGINSVLIAAQSIPSSAISALAVEDLEGDGRSDLVIGLPGTNSIGVLSGLPTFGFAARRNFVLRESSTLIHIADVNGDSRPDVIGSHVSVLTQSPPPVACPGSVTHYGEGCHGDSYFVPKLFAGGCPTPGGVLALHLDAAPGAPLASVALLFLGAQSATIPLGSGCSLLAFPIVSGPFALPISGSGAGGGSISVYVPLAPSVTSGTVFLQAFVPHPTVAWGYANSNGLRIDLN